MLIAMLRRKVSTGSSEFTQRKMAGVEPNGRNARLFPPERFQVMQDKV